MNEKVATRCIFFIAGLAASAWAVMVPFAKINTGANEAVLGVLLLCLGGGAIISMPLAGPLTARFGCRKIIGCAVLIILLSMPFLTLANDPVSLGLLLLTFGTGIGLANCAMNIQAILVEKSESIPLMSGFHGMYSVGGIAGAGVMTGLLTVGLNIQTASLSICLIILVSSIPALLAGYFFIGAGCANIVPVMFSQIGKQQSMPQAVAVPTVTTMGYIGVLAGPAMIGFIAHRSSLPAAFIFVAALMILVLMLNLALSKTLKLHQEI